MRHSALRKLLAGVAGLLFTCTPGLAALHTFDAVELPNGGGTQFYSDGITLSIAPGGETFSAGVIIGDGLYVPQVVNINLYDDAAHTILSDTLQISIVEQNPGQISLFLSSSVLGIPLPPLSPENLALTETEGVLQTIGTFTNSNGNQTIVRFQSQPDAVPEPSSFLLLGSAAGALLFRRRGRA